ncbi:orotidine-5'-phosphate decarboxylase [Virgibacillus siamensis]|uniref:orotidine-5'-phosphate decarboxylase n=1 Tax=Virgibacillus siamensis TaxID=480071 RepID=UPI0009856A78|nr:orotidine-5'-phosphate decarboxylase [Virgibacillus siamensis]
MKGKTYLSLDFPTWEDSKAFLDHYDFHGVPVKVGMELFYREGPKLIERLKENNHAIFLDLKLFDIPTTVMKAMKNIAKLEVDMVNVHALGGSDMIKWAKEGLTTGAAHRHETKLIAVTILTSTDEQTMQHEMNIKGNLQENVVSYAKFAAANEADGVVCSVHEAQQIKRACGSSFLTVTPGIRLAESLTNDQKRPATPAFAKENGADILVLGRTVTQADNPKAAFKKVQKEWGNGIKS